VEETGQLLVVLLPSLWLCSVYISWWLGVLAGGVWIVTRFLFALELNRIPPGQEMADTHTNKLVARYDLLSQLVVRMLVLSALIVTCWTLFFSG